MSSATSIKDADAEAAAAADPASRDQAMRPWQFFLLAGMLSATAVVVVATGQSAAAIIVLSLTVIASSLVALGAYRALVPLVLPETADAPAAAGRARAALEREKTLALRAIKELEFDFAMGKIARADFEDLSGRLRARAMGLMRELDAGGYRRAIDHEVQTRLARRLAAADTAATPATAATREPAASGCAGCGTVNDPDARFCKQCGASLA